MFTKVLIANRGEICARVVKTLRRMGIASVAVYSDADRFTLPVLSADEAVHIGPSPAKQSYLDIDAVIAACKATGAQAVHPGYGFLSENAGFVERLNAAGITFIGPRVEHLQGFGLKHTARALAKAAGVPLLPGTDILEDAEAAQAAAAEIGFPVMLKSTAGGGGIGMQLCHSADELAAKFAAVQRMATSSFGDARVYLERFVAEARHVEVQIFGDGKGGVVALGERDCSLQRRNQKVVEETPAPGLPDAVRLHLRDAAIALGQSVKYASAGTVEFIYDVARAQVYFLEVNTRLQVEHPATEAVFGVDLVEWMVRQAAGDFTLPPQESLIPQGAAIEVRLYAENAAADFRPSTGLLTEVTFPTDIRVDGWVATGTEVTANYDPMLAKLIVHADSRDAAIDKLSTALSASRVAGIETNLSYLSAIIGSDIFRQGKVATSVLKDFAFTPATVEVLSPGAQTSVQDWPGRLGYWDVGVPPSGPMDDKSFRLANRLLGNAEGTAALECTLTGPSLRFNADATIALTGAVMAATLDGAPVSHGTPVAIKAGQTLALGRIQGAGQRTYLAVAGGFDAPTYLGSKATFALGRFGGHATGCLKAGDTLALAGMPVGPAEMPALPVLSNDWYLSVHYGPHGAPDFFQEDDIADLFAATYEVHFNSARTGVRLIGPRPKWARADGGEAGLHPSNIHDNAYAIGAVDFTGDMPIILGPDGPSLGGFVCPVVVAKDDLWKVGQLRPGDKVRFVPVAVTPPSAPAIITHATLPSPILSRIDGPVPVVYRRAGDDYLLVEYGPMALDLGLRLRVHLLVTALRARALPGIIDLTPGIRSLQVHYDSGTLKLPTLLSVLAEIEAGLGSIEQAKVPSRIVHLPLSWNDPQVRLAMTKYQELVRADAPWCPDNIEFIRRINGLDSQEDVKRVVFDASYLVYGLGDVYLGAPVATPLDPRHRLVTTKYNPARTWTPENAVGIGGAYMCIYGMEGPGGYQLFGRTIQVWNSWRSTPPFQRGSPWLLRFFDQIRFFPVTEQELAEAREAFPHGRYPVRIEETTLDYADHLRFQADNANSIDAFKTRQQAAFEAEREDWKSRGLDSFVSDDGGPTADATALPDGCSGIETGVTGNVWKVMVEPGQVVAAGDTILILESMKMEMEVKAATAGRIREVTVKPGRTVNAGQTVAILEDIA
ncbi:urea carboxylase [Niveispirillum cyanobacteriorum]|uniref:Urea carboxylase n=1 Tax=Niveispirillum cyanobacteriorum TaxID=1612173 RepID=A0A2K9NI74_9PROT|nr:urea carboxylase [Niveispirillum cyanobacteriorum]AUN32779.1 urea carboxylase [Niveispirillum cyanobacteriorum]GGE87705.1 urea carboxylase [Niveispirillum cyanobacteriorum]